MIIGISSDHAGFELKKIIKKYLLNKKIKVEDFGAFSKKSVDYPDFVLNICNFVKNNKLKLGILICGTGIGMSITANKIKEIRCALCNDIYSAKMAREHNDANILAIGARIIGTEKALFIVDTFINSKFEFKNKKHQNRLQKIKNIEKIIK